MNRTDRLYAIREELRRAGDLGRTAEQLADAFAISTRTVKRDISALQAGGFPVWARIGRTGGYAVDADATLPPVALTAAEASGLALALATTGQGHPFGGEARTALLKILAVTPRIVRERIERLTMRVWVDHGEQPSTDPGASAILAGIGDALADQVSLRIDYRDAEGRESRRLVDPQLLAYTDGRWYLVAFCHRREAIRWFRIERVLAAAPTHRRSVDHPVDSLGRAPVSARPIMPA